MKDRFWEAYYYIMWFCVVFGIFIIIDADDNSFGWFKYGDEWIGEYLMASAIPLAIIRYILIAKHFWIKPNGKPFWDKT